MASGDTKARPRRPARRAQKATRDPLSAVSASGVFDVFDYDFSTLPGDDEESRLTIIFGENGVGKTTLLSGIYHLLSPAGRHQVALTRLPIRQLKVTYSSGAHVEMQKEDALVGPCELRATDASGEMHSLTVIPVDSDRQAPPPTREAMAYRRHLAAITTLPLFVGDDRSVDSDEFGPPRAMEDLRYLSPVELREMSAGANIVSWARSRELITALERAERALRDAAIGGLSSGGASTQSIYADVTRRMRTSEASLTSSEARDELATKIAAIRRRGADFSKYHLIPLEQVEAIDRELTKVRRNWAQYPLLHKVLDPYLTSLSAQLDELEPARKRIDAYVTSVNAFLRRKQFAFSLNHGLWLSDRYGEALDPAALSSGEKHLLLLLSYAVVAHDTGGLFLIDEPELSLGIEWKRTLLREMLKTTQGGNVQFIVASHSVEVMSPYRDRLVAPVEREGREVQ